jgi:superfamily II helicase
MITRAKKKKERYTIKNDRNIDRKVLPICFLCKKVPEEGIRSGFFLKGIFICNKCEQELINSQPEKREEYMLTIAKLRNILFQNNKLL